MAKKIEAEKTVNERLLEGVKQHLIRTGYDVLDTDNDWIVATSEEDELVFAKVNIVDEWTEEINRPSRAEFENFSLKWMKANHDKVDIEGSIEFRFDLIEPMVINDHSAAIRHVINVMMEG